MPIRRLLVLFAALMLLGAACTQDDDTQDEPTGEAFSLVGEVTAIHEDMEPEGVPEDEDVIDDDGAPDEGGALMVRPDENRAPTGLDDCMLDDEEHMVFYTTSTDFDPAETVDATDFPDNLEGETITADGLVYLTDAGDVASGCTIVADRIEVGADAGADTDADDDGAGTGATASPGATGSPDPDESPSDLGEPGSITDDTPEPDQR